MKLLTFSPVIHIKKPLSNRCHMSVLWTIPVVCLHALYVATLVGVTAAVHHIEFRFDELRDLWRGILVSSVSVGIIFHTNIRLLLLRKLGNRS